MAIINYIPLHLVYKEITHTKKIKEGAWMLVWSERKSKPITLVVGQLKQFTKTGSLTLHVNNKNDVLFLMEGEKTRPLRFLAGNMTYKLQEDGVRAWKWTQPDGNQDRPDPITPGLFRYFTQYK